MSFIRQIPYSPAPSIFCLASFLVEDLIKYLDPEYIDRIAIPDASKLQFILAGSAGQCVHMHLGIMDRGGSRTQRWPPCQSSHGYSSGNCCLEFWPGSGLRPEVILWSSSRPWLWYHSEPAAELNY